MYNQSKDQTTSPQQHILSLYIRPSPPPSPSVYYVRHPPDYFHHRTSPAVVGSPMRHTSHAFAAATSTSIVPDLLLADRSVPMPVAVTWPTSSVV